MRYLFTAMFLGTVWVASAQALTVQLSATIEDIGQNYFGGGVVDRFALGEVVGFSFDYGADDSVLPGDPNGMRYVVTKFTITSAAYTATLFDRGALKFQHADDYDSFQMYSGYEDLTEGHGIPIPGVPLLDGYYLSSFGFSLEASSGGAFASESLNQPLTAGMFDGFNFHFAFREPGTTRAMGTMQGWQLNTLSSTASPVPEPGSAGLFAAGAAMLGGWLLRARRRGAFAAAVRPARGFSR